MGLNWPKCSEGFLGLPFSTPVPHVTNVLFMWHVHLGVNSVVADRLPVTWYYLKYWNVSPRAGLITFNEIVLMTRRSLVLALICRPVSNLKLWDFGVYMNVSMGWYHLYFKSSSILISSFWSRKTPSKPWDQRPYCFDCQRTSLFQHLGLVNHWAVLQTRHRPRAVDFLLIIWIMMTWGVTRWIVLGLFNHFRSWRHRCD